MRRKHSFQQGTGRSVKENSQLFGWRIASPDEATLISGSKGRGDRAAAFKIDGDRRHGHTVVMTTTPEGV
jgi:hypothetical protein